MPVVPVLVVDALELAAARGEDILPGPGHGHVMLLLVLRVDGYQVLHLHVRALADLTRKKCIIYNMG